jgi:ribonuclease P protein component
MNKTITLNRLKGKEKIKTLFQKGSIHRTKNLLISVLEANKKDNRLYVGVSVPKRNFKRAVDRNRIKRQLRIALKTVEKTIPFDGSCMLIFNGRKSPATHEIINELKMFLKP